jgi:PST family polysaccharide transporter
MVIMGAIIGQRWGVSGVAIAVSIAMGFNWLSMAWLAGSVTGLPASRFVRAHGHGAVLAAAIGIAAAAAAEASRAGRLPPVATLLITGLTAAGATFAAGRLWPDLFLGPHGRWSVGQLKQMFRRGRVRSAAQSSPHDGLAMEKANPK